MREQEREWGRKKEIVDRGKGREKVRREDREKERGAERIGNQSSRIASWVAIGVASDCQRVPAEGKRRPMYMPARSAPLQHNLAVTQSCS